MKHISFFNISPVQFFDSTQYDDIDDFQDKVIDTIETIQDSQDEGILIDPIFPKAEDITLDIPPSISPNFPRMPTGNGDGVIAKIPVVLAQLVIPINITSSIDLPKEASRITDIETSLELKECILLQPSNILFIKGFVNKSIDYSILKSSNHEKVYRKLNNYKVDIPFECSTAVSFFTNPLESISNTKETFQYDDMNLSSFNQISEEFFNEIPFYNLLSSKIIEFDEFINSKDFINIQEKMVIEIRIEILQNQPIVILPSQNLP